MSSSLSTFPRSASKFSLRGRTIVVTGATRGIGRGIVLGLAEQGAHIIVTGRTKTGNLSLQTLVDDVRRAGGTCDTYAVDHSDDAQMSRFFESLEADLKSSGRKLDVFVNNAYAAVDYINENSLKNIPFWKRYTISDGNDDPAAVWDLVNNVGLRGNYVCSVLATRLMLTTGGGIVVNVSSLGGLSSVFDPAYCVGKSGIDRMTAEFALNAPSQVRYLTYSPFAVATEDIMSNIGKHANDVTFADWNLETPLFVGRAFAALLASKSIVEQAHGRVVLAAEIAEKFRIEDEKGFRPLSLGSLRFWAQSALPFLRTSFLRHVIPRGPLIPLWAMREFVGAVKYW